MCAIPQKDGSKTSAAGEVVNGYYAPATGSYIAGTLPTIALSNPRGTTTAFAAGDMALVIQMQCVDLNMTDTDSYGDGVAGFPASGYVDPTGTCRAGQYEYVPAGAGTTPSSFVAGAALQNTYVQADPTATTTRRSFQIIRVPQYSNLTLGGQLNGLAWDGRNGGVVAVDTAKNTNFAGQTIFAGAQGFRGAGGRPSNVNGNNPFRYNDGPGVAHAGKAEGLAGTPPLLFADGSPFDRNDSAGTVTLNVGTLYGYPGNTGTVADYNYAKGAPATAGGGGTYRDGAYHNGGGGGGGNGGAGGRGGFGWRSAGWAGVASDYSNIVTVTGDNLAAFGGSRFGGAGGSRIALGGGGGAGDQNGNSNNTREMAGATGGGIVIIRSGSLSGAVTIDVRGGVANTNPLNDAAGAGAAGGSAILISPNWTTGVVTINAGGGQGGDAWLSGTGGAHSGGGGGGGGVVVRSGSAGVDISGGTNGITNTSDNPPGGASHGALPGNTGLDLLIAESADPMTNSGYRCLPQTDLSIGKSASPASISIGQTTTFTLTIGNSGPAQATAAAVIDVLPPGLGTLTFVSAAGSNAATTLTASSITGLNTFTGTVTIPANQTLTILLNAKAAANGAPVNTATVVAPAASSDSRLTDNTSSVAVVIGPSADLSATKVASTPSLALGQTTTFTLTYINAGPSAVTGAILKDTLPGSMKSLTFVSTSIAGGSTLTNSVTTSSAFNGTATLPAGSTLTVVLQAVGGTAGAVFNTTTIAVPAGITDPTPGNNTATALINIGPQADLSISKSASPTVILYNQTTTFTITASNLGPNAATAARILDVLPSGLFAFNLLSATGVGGGTLTASVVASTQFDGTVTLPANGTVTLLLSARAGALGTQVNNATITAPVGVIDPVLTNNTTQAAVIIPESTSLSISKTNLVASVAAGSTTAYSITVNNNGPAAANGSILKDPAAVGLSCSTPTCTASGGAVCPTPPLSLTGLQGTGINLDVFPAGSSMIFTVPCSVTATGL